MPLEGCSLSGYSPGKYLWWVGFCGALCGPPFSRHGRAEGWDFLSWVQHFNIPFILLEQSVCVAQIWHPQLKNSDYWAFSSSGSCTVKTQTAHSTMAPTEGSLMSGSRYSPIQSLSVYQRYNSDWLESVLRCGQLETRVFCSFPIHPQSCPTDFSDLGDVREFWGVGWGGASKLVTGLKLLMCLHFRMTMACQE